MCIQGRGPLLGYCPSAPSRPTPGHHQHLDVLNGEGGVSDVPGGHRCSRTRKEYVLNFLPAWAACCPRCHWLISSQLQWESKGSMNTWEILISLFQQPHSLVSQVQMHASFRYLVHVYWTPYSVPDLALVQIQYISALIHRAYHRGREQTFNKKHTNMCSRLVI